MTGILYVVATPIGNLGDMTFRAVETLKSVQLIACEDTRVARKLLQHYAISTAVVAYHAHSDASTKARILARLEAGDCVALVSDAGTPLVSDPGEDLVRDAIARGIEVAPIPGASAILAALACAGLPTYSFLFLGFLPRDAGRRREVLTRFVAADFTLVVYEAPGRVRDTLNAIARTLGERSICVGKELTKRFEAFFRGTTAEVLAALPETLRGEFVIVVGPSESRTHEEKGLSDVLADVRRLIDANMSASEIARTIAGAHGIPKRRAYEMVLEAKAEVGD
ncbi:MAG: 16S rRNA (cytidine(1402)-2'-O)-methyltransferase [Deltaproteobacteria bacterium]|nr:16S rRNA (cytidine(1402)-2'-O)-methyltransferase [Deltaproteobacteria bacterium]